MIEVELLDDDRPPRDFNPVLLTVSEHNTFPYFTGNLLKFKHFDLKIRDSIINQSTGSKWMLVKNHYDEMVRRLL